MTTKTATTATKSSSSHKIASSAVGGPASSVTGISRTRQSQQSHHLGDPESDSNSSHTIDPADNMFASKKKTRRRSRKKTLKILHLFTPGHLITLAILFLCNRICAEPGYLDFDNLPETNFTCAGKVIGGYYADLETSCQMFHVCTIGQLDEPMDIKFLCLNGTVFDQETRVCERVDEVDCSKSEKFYYLNLELYGNTMVPMPEEAENSGSGNNYESTISTIASSSASTAKPLTLSTTHSPTKVTTTTTKPPPSSATTKRTNYQHGFNIHQSQPPPPPAQPRPTPSYTYNGTRYNLNESPPKHYSTPLHYLSSTLSPKISSTQSNRNQPQSNSNSNNNNNNNDQNAGPFEEEEEEEYEYEDDYVVVTEHSSVGTKSSQGQGQQKPFSPQQFIFDQNREKAKNQNTPTKPAISFQQQRFQNNGPSQFATNHQGNSGQKSSLSSSSSSSSASGLSSSSSSSSTGNENRPYSHTSTTNRPAQNQPSYNNYYPHEQQQNQQHQQQQQQQLHHQSQQHQQHNQQQQNNQQQQQQQSQLPKRIPLLTLGQQQQQQLQNNINFQQQQQLTFRVRGSGFQLPGGPPPPPLSQPRPFTGYQRPPPPQVPLQLPFETRSLREQKDLLGFEDVAESFITPQERKDAKRSDPGDQTRFNVHGRRNGTATTLAIKSLQEEDEDDGYVDDIGEQDGVTGGDEEGEEEVEDVNRGQNRSKDNAASHNLKKYSTTYSNAPAPVATKDKVDGGSVAAKGQQKYDKTLLIPQERYKSTLPKIIITASASVSDASGKKLNYSLGNVLGQGKELKIPPPTYDDYKEEDVVLDPFFQDVPKINKNDQH